MKLIYAIVQNDDSKKLIRELTNRRISVTRISSTGGFHRRLPSQRQQHPYDRR